MATLMRCAYLDEEDGLSFVAGKFFKINLRRSRWNGTESKKMNFIFFKCPIVGFGLCLEEAAQKNYDVYIQINPN